MTQQQPFSGGPVPWGSAPVPPQPQTQVAPAPPLPAPPPSAAPPGFPPPPPPPVAAAPYPPAAFPPPPPPPPGMAPPPVPTPAVQHTAQPPAGWFSPPPRRRNVKPFLVAGLAAVVVVAIAVAAVVLSRPEKRAPVTTLEVPAGIAYVKKVSDRPILKLLDQVRVDEGYARGSVSAAYADYTSYAEGDGTIAILVVAGPHRSTALARRGWMSSREAADAKVDRGLRYQEVAAGPLGGVMRCSNVRMKAMLCRFADDAVSGTVMFVQYAPADAADLHELARAVRGSFEKRS